MSWIKKHYLEAIFLAILVLAGGYFRFKGISSNHSFWSDEALTGEIAKKIVIEKTELIDGINTLYYQRLQIISNVVSLKLFGLSEWSLRFPSVIWGSVGIVFTYLLAKKYSNRGGGFLASFLYSFLQINLANSTQAKPYAGIETILLIVLYLVDRNIILSVIFASLATLYNYLGIVAFIPILLRSFQMLASQKNKSILIGLLVSLGVVLAVLFRIDRILILLTAQTFNWSTYLREIFWRQYGFITLPAIFGLFLIKNKKFFYSVSLITLALLGTWTLISYSHNLRYILPIFGILIVLFGIFWGIVGEKLFKKPYLICLLVAVIMYAGGNKIARKPSVYYSPNADLYADVQNADFKTFFQKTYEMFPDFDNLPVFVGPFDTLSWYTKKYPSAIFSISTPKPVYVDVVKSWQYGSLEDFKKELAKYPKGLVIVNDWQSYMPEDIKEYVRKNMKLELRVESLSVSPDDKWPLELYSWGMFKKIK